MQQDLPEILNVEEVRGAPRQPGAPGHPGQGWGQEGEQHLP